MDIPVIYIIEINVPDNCNFYLFFALKYEGINLLFFKLLFDQMSDEEVITIIQTEPSGQNSRKIWFRFYSSFPGWEWPDSSLPYPSYTVNKGF